MISGISFTGREEMLTKGIKAKKGYGNELLDRYVNEGTIFSRGEQLQAEKMMNSAKKAPQGIQRHEFISQTELVNEIVKPVQDVKFVSDSMPHGVSIDLKA